ncbi:hypothetical protein ACHAXT_011080 [Thalassiosira profunda]
MSGFTLSNNLQSSESAEELQKLIRDMQSEFQRLRWSKVKAEARAEKLEHSLAVEQKQAQEVEARAERLETDLAMARADNLYKELNIDQHEMDERIKSLSAENARLKSELSECKITSGEQAGNAFQLERENRELQTELSIHRDIQQQEIDRHIESLTAEKDRLISNLFQSKLTIGQMAKKMKQLENENKLLKVDTVQMQKALEVLLPKGGGAQKKSSAYRKRRGSTSKGPLSSSSSTK